MHDYIHIGHAPDLENAQDRRLYRFLEMLPGILAWGTLFLTVLLSFWAPSVMAIFIIIFDIYWLLKTIYLSVHMRSAFERMTKNLARNWLSELDQVKPASAGLANTKWQDLYHAVILPMAYEPLSVVRQSIESLAKINYPLDKMIIVLATEQRAGEQGRQVAQAVEKEFGHLFFKFLVTEHPVDLLGEIPGKGSNSSWAGQKVKEYLDSINISYQNVLASVFDIDTVVPPDFFACLTWNFMTAPRPLHSSFQPIPLFTNNIWEAPAFARIFAFSTTFWQMIQQARPERLVTFSSQSLNFKALVEVNFWIRNVVSEDSRIFWECLLRYDGDWRTVPLYYPVYMDANVASTFWQTLKNQYRQIRRWSYGVENNPYLIFGFLKNKKIPLERRVSMAWFMTETSHSLATNSFIIFLLGWLPLAVGGAAFSGSVLSYNLPHITRFIMNIAMIGLASSAILSVILLPPRPPQYGRFSSLWMLIQWILFPLNLIFFGAIPAIDAQTRLMFGKYLGFWITPKTRREVAIQSE